MPIDSSGLFSVENIVPTVSVLCVCLLLWGPNSIACFVFSFRVTIFRREKEGPQSKKKQKEEAVSGKIDLMQLQRPVVIGAPWLF